MRKKLCIILVLLLSIMMNGCGDKKASIPSSNAANKVEDKVGASGKNQYDIAKATYTDQNIKINYPQISNLSDSGKQKRINELIKTSALEVLDDYKDSLSSLDLNMDFEIKYKGPDLLSIQYLGLALVKDAAHPNNVIHNTNIDLKTEKQLVISEVVTVNDSFAEKIMAGNYKAYRSDLNLESAGVLKDVLNQYDSHSLTLLFRPYTSEFYLTKDSLGVSMGVEHALGDHLEMEMTYTSLGGLLSIKPQGAVDISADSTSNTPVGSTATAAPNPANSTAQPSGTKVSMEMKYKKYANARFGYSLTYPDLYTKSEESDNGDGVSMESSDGVYTLKIWGANNLNNATGKTLLADAEKRVAYISEKYAEDNFYRIEYGGGGDGKPLTFYEYGYITGDYIFGFIIRYPAEEKDKFAEVIARMTNDLKKR